MEDFLKQVLNFVATFSPQLVLLLFLICALGELWIISVPYLLETVWLLAGYNVSIGILSPFHAVLLWLVAQAGRQTGVLVLSSLSRLGSIPLTRLYQKYVAQRFKNSAGEENRLSKILNKIDSYLSPFSVALGRLLGLGTLLTVTLGIKRKFKALFLGVLLSSVVFDGIFILLGVIVGANMVVKPIDMFLFSIIGLTILYLIIFAIRRVSRFVKSRVN